MTRPTGGGASGPAAPRGPTKAGKARRCCKRCCFHALPSPVGTAPVLPLPAFLPLPPANWFNRFTCRTVTLRSVRRSAVLPPPSSEGDSSGGGMPTQGTSLAMGGRCLHSRDVRGYGAFRHPPVRLNASAPRSRRSEGCGVRWWRPGGSGTEGHRVAVFRRKEHVDAIRARRPFRERRPARKETVYSAATVALVSPAYKTITPPSLPSPAPLPHPPPHLSTNAHAYTPT